MKQPQSKPGYICLGVITGAHGIKGEVKVKAFTENPKDITTYGVPVNFNGDSIMFSNIRFSTKGIIAHIDGVNTRTDAEKFKSICLYVSEDKLPVLDETNAYLSELRGMKIIREDGEIFGVIVNAFDNGAHTVIDVKTPNKTVCIPFIDDIILHINHGAKNITVSPIVDEFLEL